MIPRPRPLRTLLATAALLLPALTTAARADDVDAQQWTIITAQKELSDKWRLYLEAQPRFGPDLTGKSASGTERLLLRGAIGYRLNPKLSIWQGYAWTPQYLPTELIEKRSFQQLLFEDKNGQTAFTNRARLEQRFIDGARGTAWRLRNMVRFARPIKEGSKWSAVAYDELFINLNSTDRGPTSGYDQNRLFIGVSRPTSPKLRIETGYLFAHMNRPRTPSDRKIHAWVVQLAFTP